MADNFNLRSFLSENKLTKNSKLLKENSDYGFDDVMDAIANDFEPGTPEFEQMENAVQDAFHNGQVDTSDFAHDLSAPSHQMRLIAREIGLDEAALQEVVPESMEKPKDVHKVKEGADDKGKMARTHVAYSASVTLGDEDGRQYIQHIRASVKKGEDAEERAAKLIQKHFEEKAEKGDPFTDGKFIKINAIGKVRNPERSSIEEPVMKEVKLTTKEQRLVEMVQAALREEDVDYTMGRQDDPNQLPNPAPELNIPEGEGNIEEAKPLPKYNSIEELMKEIEHGTNEAAHKYKMDEMKRVYEALEAKVGSLEEGENAEHIDQKKVKQMRKDIAALRKAEEKLRKEFDKKFTGKEKKEGSTKEKAAQAL